MHDYVTAIKNLDALKFFIKNEYRTRRRSTLDLPKNRSDRASLFNSNSFPFVQFFSFEEALGLLDKCAIFTR